MAQFTDSLHHVAPCELDEHDSMPVRKEEVIEVREHGQACEAAAVKCLAEDWEGAMGQPDDWEGANQPTLSSGKWAPARRLTSTFGKGAVHWQCGVRRSQDARE